VAEALAAVKAKHPDVTVVPPSAIFDVDCGFARAAGAIDDATIPRLRTIVAGAANNQLKEPRHTLAARGILYAPDDQVNAGGIINISCAGPVVFRSPVARENRAHSRSALRDLRDRPPRRRHHGGRRRPTRGSAPRELCGPATLSAAT
jgi:hypothetical protein